MAGSSCKEGRSTKMFGRMLHGQTESSRRSKTTHDPAATTGIVAVPTGDMATLQGAGHRL
jgi:hypothetical protein